MSSAEQSVGLSRRSLLVGAAVAPVVGMFAISTGVQAASGHEGHEHHHAAADDFRVKMAQQANDCAAEGQACMQHCIELFNQGDTSTAACADSVQQMMAACRSLSQLATSGSRHLAAMTQVCMNVCEDCEKECRKHAAKHAACKTCADSCVECIKACKAYLGRPV